jgi:hypothetical protein
LLRAARAGVLQHRLRERPVRARREAYDDIATGGGTAVITTRERTIAGALPPSFSYGGKDNIAVGSPIGAEKVIVKGTTLMTGERLG